MELKWVGEECAREKQHEDSKWWVKKMGKSVYGERDGKCFVGVHEMVVGFEQACNCWIFKSKY